MSLESKGQARIGLGTDLGRTRPSHALQGTLDKGNKAQRDQAVVHEESHGAGWGLPLSAAGIPVNPRTPRRNPRRARFVRPEPRIRVFKEKPYLSFRAMEVSRGGQKSLQQPKPAEVFKEPEIWQQPKSADVLKEYRTPAESPGGKRRRKIVKQQ